MRVLRPTALALLAIALLPASAGAQSVLQDFQRNGAVNPCDYSPGQLNNGLKNLPPDVQQYAPGLADQLAAGRGNCGGGGGGTEASPVVIAPPGLGPPPGAQPKARIIDPPAAKVLKKNFANVQAPAIDAPGDEDVPSWVVAILLGMTLVGLAWFAVWFTGWSPERFTRPWRASFAEAGGRTADALAELRDTLRYGR